MMALPPLSLRARHMHLGRCHPRRDLTSAHAFSLATDLYPLRGTACPHRCARAPWQASYAQAMCNQGNISPCWTRAGMPTWRGGRGVNGRPPTAACKGACVYKDAKPSESHILFALAGIFVHVCRRCQRADRAGGFHVGLIFCNFSIKRKVKDYNYLRDCHLPQSTMFTHYIALSNKEVLFPPSHWCHQVYNYPHQKKSRQPYNRSCFGVGGTRVRYKVFR